MDMSKIESAVKDWLSKNKSKAEQYTKDPEKMHKLVEEANKKSKNVGPVGELLESIQLLVGVTRDWVTGRYKNIPVGSIIAITLALIYFVSPIDIVPDPIPGIGLVDDVLVVGLVLRQVRADLNTYKEWKDAKEEVASTSQA